MYPNKILVESLGCNMEKNPLGRVEIKVFKVGHLGGYFQGKH